MLATHVSGILSLAVPFFLQDGVFSGHFLSGVADSVERMFESVRDRVATNRVETRADEYVPVRRATVPSGLDQMAPGPVLAAFLSSIDVGALSGHDRVTVVRAPGR